MRRTGYIIILLIIASAAVGQDFPVSQFMYNPLIFNPAAAGKNEVFTFDLLHRSQWIGFEGAPSSQVLNLNWPLKNEKVALGISLINDEIGSRDNKSFFLNYAYRLYLGKGKLSMGLKGGFTWGGYKLSELSDGEYPAVDRLDRYFLPNCGIGILYYTPAYYVGFSVPQLLGYRIGTNSNISVYHSFARYRYYFSAGYSYRINSGWMVQPSLLASMGNGSVQPEINCNVIYKETVTGGVSYRSKDALVFLAGYRLNYQTRIGISYDAGLGKLSNYHCGSFEINLQYLLGYKIKASNPGIF